MKKLFDKILAILTIICGVVMLIFAFQIFFGGDEEAIVLIASLYVALFISTIVIMLGISWLIGDKKR